jgi:hypothetical protein
MTGYLASGVPAILLFSLCFFCVGFGYFFRTRSVKLALIMLLLLAPFVVSSVSGLYLGIILSWQQTALMFAAVMVAGVLISFMKN